MKIIVSLFLLLIMSLASAEAKNSGGMNLHCGHSIGIHNGIHMDSSDAHNGCTQSSAINNSIDFSEITVPNMATQFSLMVDTSYESIISTIATPPPTV